MPMIIELFLIANFKKIVEMTRSFICLFNKDSVIITIKQSGRLPLIIRLCNNGKFYVLIHPDPQPYRH